MIDILDLSPELLLCVASFLAQVDLLNVSATCWRLRATSEPELYREYSNPFRRSLVPFIKRLVERPDLAKYVRRLDLKAWDTLEVIIPDHNNRQLDEFRPSEPSEADYHLITDAAKAAGVIDAICPYGESSCVVDEIRRFCIEKRDDHDEVWYEHLYDNFVTINDVPYDRKFCQLLRAGTEDSLVVLIVALLPNVSTILMQGAPGDRNALPWKAPKHNFHALRRLSGRATDGELRWPAAWFNNVLEVGKLETFETWCASSWWHDNGIAGQSENQMSFSLQPRSLNLKHIVLQGCQMDRTEIRDLLNACHHLESFYYSTDEDTDEDMYNDGPNKIYPAEIVRLLGPHKDFLVDLFLNIAIDDQYDAAHDGIKSLAHFSRLELLDTTVDLWHYIQIDNVDRPDIEDCDRLCNRLPPNIAFVNFGDVNGLEVSVHQVRDLLHKSPGVLPNLQCLMIASVQLDPEFEREPFYPEFKIDHRQGIRFDFQETDIIVSNGLYVKDTFLSEGPGHPAGMDLTKWTGSKYERSAPKSWRRPGTEYQDDIELTDFTLDNESMSEDDRTEAVWAPGFLDVEDIVDEDDDEENEEVADS
jgi:hypothetical protein